MTAVTVEKETLRRVQDGLFHLAKGVKPFVEARMRAVHGDRWLHYASRANGSPPNAPLDAYGLIKTMLDSWREAFDESFARNEKQKVRNFASTALEARNATAHLAVPLQDDEALRYLDAMHQLLKAAKAPASELAELKRLYDEQRRSGFASPAPAPQPAPTGLAALKLDFSAAEASSSALKPWIQVALPHPDVLENRFKEAEFAADLFAVDAGLATDDYADAASFFRITFLTEGLRRVLTATLQRLAGSGGDPVIGLQTAFGGGKTHTMLAVLHLARSADLSVLAGVGPLAEKAGVTAWRKAKTAVFVGSSKGTDVSLILKDGPKVHTLWGYIAWQLAGEEGLKLVAESEAARTNPGSELMVEVLRLAGPCVILLDELVAYVRQLPDDRFEAFLSFIQSLTEAVKMVPGAQIVGSLPESAPEAGADKGKMALLRLEKVFGRLQSAWLPAAGDETYEIIRRRLFQTLDSDGERDRDETVKAFHELYRKNAAEFPPEARESRYLELLRISYPIHPELFDRLARDWAGLEKFQRTRGVLRFMANVIDVLWQQQVRDPLIMPARIPIAHERVRVNALYSLDPAFGPVVDKEVDGESSLPSRLEANPSRRISQARAATRAARAVFLCSAPLVGQPNAGVTSQGLRLACAEPGDQLAIFGEALREVKDRATYLYEEAGRYWFSTQPTLNRLADDKAKSWPAHQVDEQISEVLRGDTKQKGSFHGIYAVPDDPVTIDEAKALSLVILGPATPHAGKGVGKSAATDTVTHTLMRCRSGQRRFRNTLLFVAADEALLDTAREAMRRAMAWESIVKDERLQQQLTQAQITDARNKARTGRDGAVNAVRQAWNHILYPVKSEVPGTPFDLEHLSITAKDRAAVPAAVYEKAKGDSVAKEQLGAEALVLYLKPLWPEDRPHLAVGEVADWFTTYVYLPKLRDRVVFDKAVSDAVTKLDAAFGFADGYDEATGEYQGLIYAKAPPVFMPPTAVLVRAEVARDHLQRRQKPMPATVGGVSTVGGTVTADGEDTRHPEAPPAPGDPVTAPRQPRRFYGSVEIDMVRPIKAFEQIVDAIALQLQRTPGAKVKLILEVEAEAPEGFAEADVGIVRDNARQLKFKAESTGFEE